MIPCRIGPCLLFFLLGAVSFQLPAVETIDEGEMAFNNGKLAIGVGVGIVSFDTNAKVTDKESGKSFFVDLEGTLGLDDYDNVNTIYGAYRFNPKHSIQFGYFAIHRESTLLDVSETFGNIVSLDATVHLEDRSRFYYLGYGYNLFRDPRSNIDLVVGLNAIDIKLLADIEGTLEIGDEEVSEGELYDADVVAPHPLVGLNLGHAFTPEWSLTTRFLLIHGSYDGVTASAVQASIISRYQFSRHMGGLLGWTYFESNIDYDDDDEFIKAKYGYTGLFLGLHVGF